VDVDLNITDIPFFRLHRAAPFGPPRVPTPVDAKIADASQYVPPIEE
jgi:hypothetical protein